MFSTGVAAITATVIAIMGSVGAAEPTISLVGGGTFAAFALVGFSLMWRSWRKELNRMDKRNTRCERRLNIVIDACNHAGVRIPPEVWREDGTDD